MGAAEIRGVARVDPRTKNLVKRLNPSEIAIIDHEDLDQVSAEGLAQAKSGQSSTPVLRLAENTPIWARRSW